MSPTTASVIGSQTTITTLPSVSSGEAKSLKYFEVDEEYSKEIKEALEGKNLRHWDFHLISTPTGFPAKCLTEIPLESSEPYELEIGSENGDKNNYICDNTTPNMIVSKLLPFPSSSNYICTSIKSTFCVRKTIKTQKINKKNFLPKQQPAPMSEDLRERFKPFGWQSPGRNCGEKSDYKRSPKKKSKSAISPVKKSGHTRSSPTKKAKKRRLNSETSLLLQTESGSSDNNDSDSPLANSPPIKRLKTLTDSPVNQFLAISDNPSETVLEPFIALNRKSPSKKKKKTKKINEGDLTSENSQVFPKLSSELITISKEKKKKAKKHKKDKKSKKKKHKDGKVKKKKKKSLKKGD